MTDKTPIIMVIAGPNGSGKTTITSAIPIYGTYINADEIKAKYELSDIEAAQQAEALRNKLLDNGTDFTFETVLSTDRNLKLLQRAKNKGYEVNCIYVLTCDCNINVARVRARYIAGGHDVPVDKIRSRYYKALALLPQLISLCDKIYVYDNSDEPLLIFRKELSQTELIANEF